MSVGSVTREISVFSVPNDSRIVLSTTIERENEPLVELGWIVCTRCMAFVMFERRNRGKRSGEYLIQSPRYDTNKLPLLGGELLINRVCTSSDIA